MNEGRFYMHYLRSQTRPLASFCRAEKQKLPFIFSPTKPGAAGGSRMASGQWHAQEERRNKRSGIIAGIRASRSRVRVRGHLGANSLIKRACRRKKEKSHRRQRFNCELREREREREEKKKGFRIFCIHFLLDEELS